ncbi:carbonic anhydrase [Kordiimonas aestuarii]|uniref:carbonic anhydrase n=1 Tax=Kordiimonas aestuarii TaxID=1005925 RepID=UPI0021D2957D|nr:carbonic anhydrase family protein [Kordiimonas aestuarii]
MNWKQSLGSFVAATALAASATGQDNWSYSGTNGPGNWGATSSVCANGSMQSPIVIEGTEPVYLNRLETNYLVSPLVMHNERRTVRFDYAPGSKMKIGTKEFELKNFHFHTPAEHRVLTTSYPMEIHFDHTAADGSLARIAVFVKEGAANIAADELWPNLPIEPDQSSRRAEIKFNARDLMPNERTFYRYMGSETTPPCTEGVNWYVFKAPIEFSSQQIAVIRGIMGENARPLQPRNNRMILDALPN